MSKPIKRQPGERTIPNWQMGSGGEKFSDISYQVAEGMAKITINRPEVRNAFRPQTLFELSEANNAKQLCSLEYNNVNFYTYTFYALDILNVMQVFGYGSSLAKDLLRALVAK